MQKVSRLDFLRLATGVVASPLNATGDLTVHAPINDPYLHSRKEVGIYLGVDPQGIAATFRRIQDLGFKSCELYIEEPGPSVASSLKNAIAEYNMPVHAVFTLGPGETTWDFYAGQSNIGLVSTEYREKRLEALMQLSELARACDIGMIETHVGYIPENPADPNYRATVEALKRIVGYCKQNNQVFLYHAGQETPTTLLRTMQDVGYDNQGVGMDTANLIMYDRGHPYHAIDVYGKYIKIVNAKDGLYPTNPKELGKEVMIGEGKVDFPSLLKKLKKTGYNGPLLIERESSQGTQWDNDVRYAKTYLEKIWNKA